MQRASFDSAWAAFIWLFGSANHVKQEHVAGERTLQFQLWLSILCELR